MNSLHAFGCRARRATQRGNVFRCEAKAKELLIIDIAELRSDALLRRVVFRQNEPPHQARSSDLAPCGGYGDALLQMIGQFRNAPRRLRYLAESNRNSFRLLSAATKCSRPARCS